MAQTGQSLDVVKNDAGKLFESFYSIAISAVNEPLSIVKKDIGAIKDAVASIISEMAVIKTKLQEIDMTQAKRAELVETKSQDIAKSLQNKEDEISKKQTELEIHLKAELKKFENKFKSAANAFTN